MTVSKTIAAGLLTACMTSSCFGIGQGPYLGQEPPGMKPRVFAPGVISLPGRFERTPNFHPNGKEFYFTIIQPDYSRQDIYCCTCDDEGQWSSPREIFFSANRTSAADVSLSSDGQRLCFSSNLGKSDFWDNDIWVSERAGAWWSEPTRLSAQINTSRGEWGPCLLNNGTVYFGRSISATNSDIYCSRLVHGEYETAQPVLGIGSNVNEWDSFVAEDESCMIFKSNRPGGYGSLDLYISFRNRDDGSWAPPGNLGPAMNTARHDDCGNVTPDGKYFMFARRDGNVEMDIYWVDIRAVLPDPNGSIENTRTSERFGSIQCAVNYADDGDTIVIQPGTYCETVDLSEKDIVLQSVDPTNPGATEVTAVQGDMESPVIRFSGVSNACALRGLTIRGGQTGLHLQGASPSIEHCRIVGNMSHGIEMEMASEPLIRQTQISDNGGTGIAMTPQAGGRRTFYNTPTLINCTLARNDQEALLGGIATLRNCIIWGNGADDRTTGLATLEATISYSCLQGNSPGEGNIAMDPRFLVEGNDHLHPASPCIDAGDPADGIGEEPVPNGGRINIGCYGGTIHATRTTISESL